MFKFFLRGLKDETRGLQHQISKLVRDLEERDQAIRLLAEKLRENREAVQELAEGQLALAHNQAIFQDTVEQFVYAQKSKGLPLLPHHTDADDDLIN